MGAAADTREQGGVVIMANIGLTAADAGTPNGTIRWREGLLLIHYEIDRPKPHEPHDEKPTFRAEC